MKGFWQGFIFCTAATFLAVMSAVESTDAEVFKCHLALKHTQCTRQNRCLQIHALLRLWCYNLQLWNLTCWRVLFPIRQSQATREIEIEHLGDSIHQRWRTVNGFRCDTVLTLSVCHLSTHLSFINRLFLLSAFICDVAQQCVLLLQFHT